MAQRLGYLAELCLQTAEVMHLEAEKEKLSTLCSGLEGNYGEWQHLQPGSPEWGKSIDKYEHNQTNSNKKWKIYSPLRVDEIEDFVDLYITRDWMNYAPLERTEMRERGIKYTRFERK